ncbi:VanZ family protein [Bacillus sp. FJAT-49732]|uniref:VanZ family protein n=1 Tax=Lederbergia citrisecunda TaxID=2833583 RepID=A0A942TPD6_9BACI|nr:VanZ family protein [Lederbergia citrisecunda]MBS4200427.1 VanZ family protein [Lederbergia citrisecunda]
MNRRYFWLIGAILWCIAIFIATASPSSTGSNTQSILIKFFHFTKDEAQIWNVVFRKCVHLSAFGLLAVLFYKGLQKNRFWFAWLLTTLYAATDELHQVFIPERTGAVLDVGIDSLGAFIALIGVVLLNRKRRERRKVYG